MLIEHEFDKNKMLDFRRGEVASPVGLGNLTPTKIGFLYVQNVLYIKLTLIETVRDNTSYESVRFNETQVYSNILSHFSGVRIYTSSICARH